MSYVSIRQEYFPCVLTTSSLSSFPPPLSKILFCPKNYKLCLPNFCSIFLCHRRWLWQIRSLQMFWWCKGSSCHQGDGDQVSELHGLLAPQRVPYGHPNAAPKSAPNLHPGAEHFYWISHKTSEHMRYKTTEIICPSWKKMAENWHSTKWKKCELLLNLHI